MRRTASIIALVALLIAGCEPTAPEGRKERSRTDSDGGATEVDQTTPEEGFQVSVEPTALPGAKIRLRLTTNIPGTIEVMAGLSLTGQRPNDVYIGKDQRVRIADGQGEVTIDTSDLPEGQYDAEVSFYPRWGFQDATSRATGITAPLVASVPIYISGSGEPGDHAQLRENSQKWVMLNVVQGEPWWTSEWTEQFGDFREVPVKGMNPRVIKAYYFPRIDMTIFVNSLKSEISHWRIGEANR